MQTFTVSKRAVSEMFFKGHRRRGQVLVLFESLLDESQPTWLFVAAKFNKEENIGIFVVVVVVPSSEAFLGVHQTSMQQMCCLFQGKLIHFSQKLCRMRL